MSVLRPRRSNIWFVLFAVLVLLQLFGCNEGDKRKMSLFYGENSRKIADQLELSSDGIIIELTPPLEVRNTVQYITLSLPSANLWRTGSDTGVLVMPDGKSIRLTVGLETVAGKRIELRSVSFGRELMFSYLNEDDSPQASDLPKGELFGRLHLTSSKLLVVDEVRWVDVTNK